MFPLKLDLKDKRLLAALDFDARATYSHLAKTVRMSKQGVEYKLNSLAKQGVIKGFYPIINVPKLGYLYCRLLVTLQNVTQEKQKEITAYFLKHQKVFWLFRMHGEYDLLIVIWARSITEFRDFSEEVNDKFGEYIKRAAETIATDVVHLQHRYLLDVKNAKEIHVRETAERVATDDTDTRILGVLSADARVSLVEIGKQVRESAKVVAYRIRRMERVGLIEGYRPIIDYTKIGYTYYKVFIEVQRRSKESFKKLVAYIKTSPLCIYVVEGIGLSDKLDIELMVWSNAELFSFIEDLRFRFPTLVGEYETIVFLDTLKVRYLPT